MLLVDSHCHLDRLSYGSKQTDMADVLAKARNWMWDIFSASA